MEEEKSWIEKMRENPEGGVVHLTKKDKEGILESNYLHEKSLAQKIRESEFFIYGILFAILGSYLATWIYELINRSVSFNIFNFVIFILFLIVFFRFWWRLNEEKTNMKLSKDSSEKWLNADHIRYGKAFKALNREEGKAMIKEMKLVSTDEEKKEIYEKYFYPKEKRKKK